MSGDYRDIKLFPRLSDAQMQWLSQYGREMQMQPGDTLFREGEEAPGMYVLLDGEVKVTRDVNGQEAFITTHTRGEFTGEISLLMGGKCIATGKAMQPSRVLFFDRETFKDLLTSCAEMREIVLPAMVGRAQEVDVMEQQREKLASLGKLAAGLAHELNNPAAAALRSAQELRELIAKQRSVTMQLNKSALTAEQKDVICALIEAGTTGPTPILDTMTRSDREDEVTDWLDARAIPDGWELSPTFVASGLDIPCLEELAAMLDGDALTGALTWLESALRVNRLIDEIEASAQRIASLVKAVKQYSFMDQAPLQEIDVHEGLENTLTMLGYKTKHTNITIEREYAADLPRICAFGSELNQVWTNLLDNAIDALKTNPEPRRITVRTCLEDSCVRVELEDNGPGISPDVQPHIFEPFFTTKGVGEGTGLGLDIAYRIVVRRHQGDITVTSAPGKTLFVIRLPIVQPQT